MNRWTDYIGIPFREGMAAPDGCDCWGLVRLVYATDFGIILDPYSDVSPCELRRVSDKMASEARVNPEWVRVESDEVREYDVCLMRVATSSLVAHAGVMIDRSRVLHVEEATMSCIVDVDDPRYRTRIAGFYRHRDLQ